MPDTMLHSARRKLPAATIAFAALALAPAGAALLWNAPAEAAPARTQMGGTWDLNWRNDSGETRRGVIIVTQRGSSLTARMPDRDNATATGSITGSAFTLQGSRYGLPFSITGRVQGQRMAGMLTTLRVERRFTGTRRR